MKTSKVIALALSLSSGNIVADVNSQRGALSKSDLQAVSPALEYYAENTLTADLWKRADLSPRDRSIVTVAVVIARNQMVLLPEQIELALDNGVSPAEISEIITHLAFYAGWGNAIAAAAITKDIFETKGIDALALPQAIENKLPLDEDAEARRALRVQSNLGTTAPGLVNDTTNILFRDLWLRPGLAPRDRSLITVSSLIANGQAQQIPVHLNRAMDNGLTQAQASGVLNHIAYYAGWPNVFLSAPVFKTVFEEQKSK